MKRLPFLIVFCLLVLSSHAQNFTIAGASFQPEYTNSSNEGFLKEYLPDNQTLDDWGKLFGVRYFKKLGSPKDYIARLGDEYREKFPWMKFASGSQKSKNRWFIDFIVYPKNDEPKFVEWNFFRAETNASGGIIVFQYAERKPFKKSSKEVFDNWDIKSLRMQMLPFLMTNEFNVDLTLPSPSTTKPPKPLHPFSMHAYAL